MIIQLILQVVISILTAMFSWLPQVSTLPSIMGVDIDTQLVNGVAMFYTFAEAVWPLQEVMKGLVILLGYYFIKMVLKIFLGHRAPGTH